MRSDAVTTVSGWLREETRRLLQVDCPIEVIPNFFCPKPPGRTRAAVRAELGLRGEAMIVHLSNLRPVKRIDRLLDAVAQVRPREAFKLVILAGGDFAPFAARVRELGLADRVVVRSSVFEIEDYLQAADLALFTSDSESFCLGILEAMWFGCPSVSTAVGGIPEVVESGQSGLLVEGGEPVALARAVERLLGSPATRQVLGTAARSRAQERFSAGAVVPQYEALYARVIATPRAVVLH